MTFDKRSFSSRRCLLLQPLQGENQAVTEEALVGAALNGGG
jgi:hypothetical protein